MTEYKSIDESSGIIFVEGTYKWAPAAKGELFCMVSYLDSLKGIPCPSASRHQLADVCFLCESDG